MNHTPDTAAIEAYRQQMMEMYHQSAPSSPAVSTEENWLDDRYPEPNIERDQNAITPNASEPATLPATDFVGYLRVFAFTGGGAEPIPKAQVIVTRADGATKTIYANLTTDRDGFTSVVALPTVDPALTLQPGVTHPYVTYTVRVNADGFQSVEHTNIPIYGDNYVTQPVAMLPILPSESAEEMQTFSSGGPSNLFGGAL